MLRMRTPCRLIVASFVVFGLVATACSDESDTTPATGSAIAGAVVVFAASSLTEAFTEMADAFAADHPDVNLTVNFAGSGDLFTQISEGAPADVFVSADAANMTRLTDAALNAGAPVTIARNTFEIIVEPGNPQDKVKGVVTKVTAGEADAGIVFVTDVNAAGNTAEGVQIPAAVNVISEYPAVITKDAPNPAAAQAFLEFVAGPAGQAILATYGFLAP